MAILLKIWGWLTSKAGMILAALVTAGLIIRSLISVGEDRQKAKQEVRRRKAREGAKKIENEVRRSSARTNRDKLRKRWGRR